MTDTVKSNESAAIAAQRAMVERMKREVLPPQSGPNVGGVPAQALPLEDVVRRADEVIPPARGKPE